jgi:hypothetical protein
MPLAGHGPFAQIEALPNSFPKMLGVKRMPRPFF